MAASTSHLRGTLHSSLYLLVLSARWAHDPENTASDKQNMWSYNLRNDASPKTPIMDQINTTTVIQLCRERDNIYTLYFFLFTVSILCSVLLIHDVRVAVNQLFIVQPPPSMTQTMQNQQRHRPLRHVVVQWIPSRNITRWFSAWEVCVLLRPSNYIVHDSKSEMLRCAKQVGYPSKPYLRCLSRPFVYWKPCEYASLTTPISSRCRIRQSISIISERIFGCHFTTWWKYPLGGR